MRLIYSTGYFVSDFSLDEIKTLRLNQRLKPRSTAFDGLLQIPTLLEIMELIKENYHRTGKLVGMYIELKHPSFHNANFNGGKVDNYFEDLVLSTLVAGGFSIKSNSKPSLEKVKSFLCFISFISQ
jgi:glycerophosphoryl diester phosphodiesterase